MAKTYSIEKASINQKCIREPVAVPATGHILSIVNVKDVPTLYYKNLGATYEVWVRAFLTGDAPDETDDYIGTLHIWGLTLHFFRVYPK